MHSELMRSSSHGIKVNSGRNCIARNHLHTGQRCLAMLVANYLTRPIIKVHSQWQVDYFVFVLDSLRQYRYISLLYGSLNELLLQIFMMLLVLLLPFVHSHIFSYSSCCFGKILNLYAC